MKLLSERIREVRPCGNCARSEGLWRTDAEGNPVVGQRCDCLRGRLLAKADETRMRKQAA